MPRKIIEEPFKIKVVVRRAGIGLELAEVMVKLPKKVKEKKLRSDLYKLAAKVMLAQPDDDFWELSVGTYDGHTGGICVYSGADSKNVAKILKSYLA